MIRSLIAALGLMALTGSLTTMPARAQDTDRKLPNLIWLTGHGEVKVEPDMAIVTVGVLTQAPAARDAVSANNAAMTKIIATLKSSGLAEKDIQTSNFSVNPRYDYPDNSPPHLEGYDVSNTVSVTVRNLAKLGNVLDDVVSEGSNQINGIAFDLADRDPVEDEARKLAVADGKHKAEIYAAATGVKLGRIASISEGMVAPPPPPVTGRAMMKADAAPSVPVARGEQTVTIDVNIAWEIN
jgi:uncharacterized protein YggE